MATVNPFPENMGFPERQTIMDMLPEEIELDRMDAIRRRVAWEKCGLFEQTCAMCGKRFEATAQHAYRLTRGGRLHMYCSYTCYRKEQRKDEEKFREKQLSKGGSAFRAKEIRKKQKQLDAVREKLRLWQGRLEAPDFAALQPYRQREIKNSVVHWTAREVLAMEALEEAKKHERG